ncbi:hypothetical protein B0H13DRAFT_2368342 [Mycena leptocephala]|nr:hypothetical protein B0H13DRAFT_2368342 [Mycena leptocephala]
MPRQTAATEIRINNIIACMNPMLALLSELNDALGPAFIHQIINSTSASITAMQNAKRHKDECLELMENIHLVLYSIVNMHMKCDPAVSLHPTIIQDIGRFTRTLHKIYTFLEAQQDGNKIKQIFRHNGMNTLLKECRAEVDRALAVFKV